MPKLPGPLEGNAKLTALWLLKYRTDSQELSMGQALVEMRRIEGLSQDDLARKAGLSKNSVLKIESDDEGVSLRSLKKVASVFGYYPAFLPGHQLPEAERYPHDNRYVLRSEFDALVDELSRRLPESARRKDEW